MEQPSIIFPDKFFLVGSTFFGLWQWKLTHFPPNPNNSLIRLSRFSISVSHSHTSLSHSHGESLTSIKLMRPRLSLNLSIFFLSYPHDFWSASHPHGHGSRSASGFFLPLSPSWSHPLCFSGFIRYFDFWF